MKFFALACLLLSLPAFADDCRCITVHGEGEIKIKPDMATVSIEVQTKGKDAKAAQSSNAELTAKITKTLRDKFKIEEKYVQSSNYSLSPEYSYPQNGKRVFLGFNVSHSLAVVVMDIEKVGGILDEVSTKGSADESVSLQGVRFDTAKRKEYEVQVLEGAMKNALARAEALARFGGKRLKGLRRISDSSLSYAEPQMEMAVAADALMSKRAAPTHISPGEITLSTQIGAEYEME